jgi:ATP citrate (pro-S)-lyase
MYNVCARVTDGIFEGIAIGGDAFPGSTLSDHCLRYNSIPAVSGNFLAAPRAGKMSQIC